MRRAIGGRLVVVLVRGVAVVGVAETRNCEEDEVVTIARDNNAVVVVVVQVVNAEQ